MVYQITKSKYRVFIETFILTLFIFMIGFFVGFLVESQRLNNVNNNYKNFEIKELDLQLQGYYFENINKEQCDEAIKENLIFADNLYNEGLLIERYEENNQINSDILIEKKRYVLLKTELWMNSMKLKKQCNNPFHTIVYVYLQNSDLTKDAEQSAIAKTLNELKKEVNNSIILIPIAGDLGLDSINMQLRTYNVTYLPSVIIDEKFVLEGFHNKQEILKLLK